MSKRFFNINVSQPEINIFADKSSLVLGWLLIEGIGKKNISLREATRKTGVSVGLVQKIFHYLVVHGYMKTIGFGTSKSFFLSKPKTLLLEWASAYSMSNKCKMWSYSSAFEGREKLLEILRKSKFSKKVVRALHSAVPPYKCVNTNLETLELYLPDLGNRNQIEEILHLEPRSRGYDVLLILPYYKSMVFSSLNTTLTSGEIAYTNPLLTFLDLYHFSLRGREQADHMAEKLDILKNILKQKS